MKTSNSQSLPVHQYNEVIVRHLDTLIQPKTKYTGKQLKDILEATYFRILPLNIAKQQRVSINYLLANDIVKRSNGHYYTKFKKDSNGLFVVLDNVAKVDKHLPKFEVILVNRNTPTIKSITELYFDLIEAYQNGDIRVKTTDYLDALRELTILNEVIPKPNLNDLPPISFTLG